MTCFRPNAKTIINYHLIIIIVFKNIYLERKKYFLAFISTLSLLNAIALVVNRCVTIFSWIIIIDDFGWLVLIGKLLLLECHKRVK